MFTTRDRAIGCLTGIATGDAIGKQTETLSRENVSRWYPHGIHGFEGAPGTVIPRQCWRRQRFVASIAGGILGAMYPDTVNERWVHVVETVNQHRLAPMAGELAALRGGPT